MIVDSFAVTLKWAAVIRYISTARRQLNCSPIPTLPEAGDFVVEAETRPSVNGGILFLTVGKHVGFPIRKTLGLADALPEKISVELLETQILNAERLDVLLLVDETAARTLGPLAQHKEIILQGKAHFTHIIVSKEIGHNRRHSDHIEAEEEAKVGC